MRIFLRCGYYSYAVSGAVSSYFRLEKLLSPAIPTLWQYFPHCSINASVTVVAGPVQKKKKIRSWPTCIRMCIAFPTFVSHPALAEWGGLNIQAYSTLGAYLTETVLY